ncbi:RcnB family protein [Sphingomonas sp. 3-13AW]|uniref:RcnB family protein n=1 Tax=Sphingomonas sp. 3-13AW TaxID=3050450 RepID=UPI003BB75CFB
MTKFLLIGLMAATALVPASAMAQERGDRPQREARGGGDRSAPRGERPQRNFQNERPQQARPQMPQRNAQNERPQQARPQMPQRDFQNARPQLARPDRQAPQRNYQGERPDRGEQLAQRRDRPQGLERPRGDGQQRWQGGESRPDRNGGRPDYHGNDGRPDRAGMQPGRPGGNWDNRDRRPGDRLDRNDRRPARAYDRNDGWRNPGRDRQDWNDRRGWSRGWRTDNRYDWNRYRQTNRNVYRLPRYYPPSGYHYGYQRFSVGLTVGSMLYGSSYWINDPYSYRLPPAYGPYRWVRYYNDALLVDLETGEVVDTVYDLFW